MTVGELGEDGLLRALAPFLTTEGVPIGAGVDDAAVLDRPPGHLVVSSDASVEDVHFDLTWMTAEDAGWRALALALGDLAAKGATPLYGLVSLAVPPAWRVEDAVGLYSGLAELAATCGLKLVGGDTSSTGGPAVLALTVLGSVERVPLARSQARPGWAVGVTGPLGSAGVALRERRPVRLQPLLDEGRRLNLAGLCCGDVSDGLVREMGKFAAWSGAGCRLEAGRVPVAEGATLNDALGGGEEAELVACGPETVVREQGLTVVGVLTEAPGVVVIDAEGAELEVAGLGYRHFA